MKDILNERVKYRQTYRPFAPLVPCRARADYFVGADGSPLWSRLAGSCETKDNRDSGDLHVDGTGRVQTVRRDRTRGVRSLISEFDKLTGVPVVVNTSFNIKGEPIVETPQDAMNCFIYTGIDYLALHDTLVAKNAFYKILAPFIRVYYDSRYHSRDETD